MGTPPTKIWSLSENHLRWLKAAAESPEGEYIPLGDDVWALVEGGAAEIREVARSSDTTRSVHDLRPCTWTDRYLIPTEWGLELLRKHKG